MKIVRSVFDGIRIMSFAFMPVTVKFLDIKKAKKIQYVYIQYSMITKDIILKAKFLSFRGFKNIFI